jgi:hypothetical protein
MDKPYVLPEYMWPPRPVPRAAGPVRVLVQTLTHLVPTRGKDDRSCVMFDLMCEYHFGCKYDGRVFRMASHNDMLGYDNLRCYFLIDYGESLNDDDVPIVCYEWTGDSL